MLSLKLTLRFASLNSLSTGIPPFSSSFPC